jgi:predicted histidine transporter YuiF (NhaC family)
MAAQTTLVGTSLSLKYKAGIDQSGKDINKVKKFSNVKVTAVNQNLLDVATAFIPLMTYPTLQVLRTDDSSIVNE